MRNRRNWLCAKIMKDAQKNKKIMQQKHNQYIYCNETCVNLLHEIQYCGLEPLELVKLCDSQQHSELRLQALWGRV